MYGDLWFEDYVKKGTDIWFAAGNYNGIYKFDTINGKVKRIATFPCESIAKSWAFRKVGLWKENLLFLPAYADAVYLYDMENGEFDRIDILDEEELSEYQEKCKFQCFEMYGDWLYLIGHEYHGIIKVNLTSRQVEKINKFPDEAFISNIEPGKPCFGTEMVAENNIIYITCISSNKVLMLDMKNDSIKVIEVGNDKNKYNGICKIGNAYYLKICDNGNIVRWEYGNEDCREIELKFDVHFYDRKLCQTKNYIWVFSYISNEIFRIDKNNFNIIKIQANYPCNSMMLVFCEETQDGIYFVNMYDGEWHFLREDGTDENLHFSLKEPDSAKIMKQFVQENRFKVWKNMRENGVATIEALLLKVNETEHKAENKLYVDYGKVIHDAVAGRGNISV